MINGEPPTKPKPAPASKPAADIVKPDAELLPSEKIETVYDNKGERYGVFPYKDKIYQMSKPELVFNYCTIVLFDPEGEAEEAVEAIICPLVTNVQHPRILVWMTHNMTTMTKWFANAAEPVTVSCGKLTYTLTAEMRGNKFFSRINLTQELKDRGYRISVKTKVFDGSKGHLYFPHNEKVIHVLPVTFANNEVGMANFVYCIEKKDGRPLQYGDNSDGLVRIEDERLQTSMVVLAKWTSGSLYGAVVSEDSLQE